MGVLLKRRLIGITVFSLMLLGVLLRWGCGMVKNQKIEEFGRVTDKTGNHQLLLKFEELPSQGDEKAFDFYSLTWEVKDGARWTEKVVISSSDFQQGSQQPRWVSRIQSI